MEQDNRIIEAFNKVKKDIEQIDKQIVSKKEIELMIRESLLEVRPRTSPRTSPRTYIRKRADKLLDQVEVCSEIRSLLQRGLSTVEMYNIIVLEKTLVKKTCFYKYLKVARERLFANSANQTGELNQNQNG